MRVEDVSEDESASVTSTKGEGYASDFSDNEAKQRAKRKNKKVIFTNLKLKKIYLKKKFLVEYFQ